MDSESEKSEKEHHEEDEAAEEEEMAEKENDSEAKKEEDDDDKDDDDDIGKKLPKQAAQVFGDELADLSDSDESEKSEKSEKSKKSEKSDAASEKSEKSEKSDNEEEAAEDMETGGANEEEQEEVESEQLIDIQIPRVKTDLGKEVHFVKLPNFLSVESRPFDHETYEDETPKGDALDEEGKTRVRLKVENTIRWKLDKDSEGNVTKQSNARIVKWSDGSMSLYLGHEIFDVYKTQTQGDHNHLFVRQGNVLHGQTVFKTKLTFRPYSTESLTHRKMTMSLVEHGSKTKKVKILNELPKNPENKRQELVKQEEEKLKAASRRLNQQRRVREKSHSKGISSNYLEDRYSDEEGISLADIKNKFKKGNQSKISINSSSDESDRERRLNKAKYNDDESDSDKDVSSSEEDEDSDSGKKAKTSKKKTKKVVSDDEDE